MSKGVVANRYAKALIGLARKQKALESTGEFLSELTALVGESPDFQEVMSSPKVANRLKQDILTQVLEQLRTSPLVFTFARYLLAKRRFSLLQNIEHAFTRQMREILGRVEAEVTVTHPLSKASRNKIEKTLSTVTGKKVEVRTVIDPTLLGGVVTRIGSTVIDGSLRNQLNQIRLAIIQGGNL